MRYEVSFTNVLIDSGLRSWSVILPVYGCREVIRHLAAQGLALDCEGDAARDECVSDEPDDEGRVYGRLLAGGSHLIGRFVATPLLSDPESGTYAAGGYPCEVPVCDDVVS